MTRASLRQADRAAMVAIDSRAKHRQHVPDLHWLIGALGNLHSILVELDSKLATAEPVDARQTIPAEEAPQGQPFGEYARERGGRSVRPERRRVR